MPRRQLRETVTRLREQLDSEPGLDAERVDKLRGVLAGVEDLLAETDSAQTDSAQPESLTERVAEATSELEASHPRLTELLAQLADVLNRMGI